MKNKIHIIQWTFPFEEKDDWTPENEICEDL